MTIDVTKLRERLRQMADEAAAKARDRREAGDINEAQFQSGRQAALVTALSQLTLAEDDAARERDDPSAEVLARYNPRYAIEGWLAGYRAYGDAEGAALMERALEIQNGWLEGSARHAENLQDEALGEEAARLGVIGQGAAVDLGAVERLEEFARTAGGAVDMASGTVHSDADEGL